MAPRAGSTQSNILPFQQYAPQTPVMGTDESGQTQQFQAPTFGFGVPGVIGSPIQSALQSAQKLQQGQVPGVNDYMPALLAATPMSPGVSAPVAAGFKTNPAAIATEHDALLNDLYNSALGRAARAYAR